ncbi:hypothetical protein TNCV_1112061 [Trichonephila clavipes]|uniref:Uncharacterized protein n=1 Tax=Trichonephila clavipes TaxID=2585209 RepID=A0A8X6V3Y5_TRICX|nr:hypothetical protein TNCV_1112061 [Trichonephila clavipes]
MATSTNKTAAFGVKLIHKCMSKHRLHPEKLTVWCALWAGGIIGPYFFENDEGHNVTVKDRSSRITTDDATSMDGELNPVKENKDAHRENNRIQPVRSTKVAYDSSYYRGSTGGDQFHVKLTLLRKYGGPPKSSPKLNSLGG